MKAVRDVNHPRGTRVSGLEGARDPDRPVSERQVVRTLLEARGLTPLKQRGQHFLVDRGVIARVVEAALGSDAHPILEIGPGLGALTGRFLAAGRQVVAIEVDRGLAGYLREMWGAASLAVVEQDALKLAWGAWWRARRLPEPLVLVGNLPYYITGPLVARLWEDPLLPWARAVFMVQREAGDRILAAPGTERAGIPSVLVRAVGHPRRLFEVPPEAFYPMPEVESVVVAVERHEDWSPALRAALGRLVHAGFGQRRKTLRRALSGLIRDPAVFTVAGVDGGRRAESLTLDEWRALAGAFLDSGASGETGAQKGDREP